MLEISARQGTDLILIKNKGDKEPIEVPAQVVLELIAEKYPDKVLKMVEFLNEL